MNVVTVVINGIEYNLKGDEQEEYLHTLASYVDKKVKSVLEINNKLSTSSAAILSAVNVADDMFKMRESNKKLEKESEQFKKIQKVYEEEIASLKKQIQYKEEYNAELQQKLKDYEQSGYSKKKAEEKDNEVQKLKEEIDITNEAAKEYLKENEEIKSENREYKFKVQSLKYKIMDLQHKLEQNQISLAKERSRKNPLLNDKSN
ncbi:MAG: cell division protein ZapA [Clostridium sp.]|jgi:cell division protein ZapA|uniref:cell division protein ZapA n=1 Tax=Clostridium sp. TaxID=1506 RepID=UPI0025BFB886|nr:cell division protein ZapA [Clostridium sp.]MCH3962838.1 cell division protein ZapA [Clostridium sp.]MCI1715747.1 cell division protein ZapA [Clostridium sp.]MCI1800048.1 cell division protein ZapA [Clostridium sp.]MCI1813962.1 cell division protein ZapA [Clostridium sp.]MCI1870860.1 cell division protein ZapA [Clostridium sp.]